MKVKTNVRAGLVSLVIKSGGCPRGGFPIPKPLPLPKPVLFAY